MGTIVQDRPRHEYADAQFAIECVDTGRIRELRENAGVSGLELARRVGVAQPVMWRWERDVVRPTLQDIDTLVRLGRELKRLERTAQT